MSAERSDAGERSDCFEVSLCLVAIFQSKVLAAGTQRKVLMKILLQSKNTRDYVDQGGGWTGNIATARVFTSGLDAMMFCLDRRILQMQIVCVFEDLARNFTIAVTDCRQNF